jgi:ATP-dependent helicase HrpB
MTKRLQSQLREELRVIVMSATLDPQPIAAFLGDHSQSLDCLGRSFPVEIVHHETNPRDRLEQSIAALIVRAARETEGHVLVFLPGLADIHRVNDVLANHNLGTENEVVKLHGSLSPSQQDEAIRSDASGIRKIILSTNIAETSVTVEGVTAVVDSGLAKVPVLDSRLGLTRLQTGPISIASADQRAGRAGRTAPGICHRMWSAKTHRSRREFDQPEILRGDLAASVLMLATLGESVDDTFGWLTPPPQHSVESAVQRLRLLGALDSSNRITPLGWQIAGLPLDPRIARFAIAAGEFLPAKQVAIAAALLSEPDPLDRESANIANMSLPEKTRWIASHPRSVSRTFDSVVRQIERSVEDACLNSVSSSRQADEALARGLLAAYPDRVAMRREGDPDRGVMVGRRGVEGLLALPHLDRDAEFVLCYDVDGSRSESRVWGAVTIDADWLPKAHLIQGVDVDFDAGRETIVCRSVRRYVDLVLKETPVACELNEATAERLFLEAMKAPDRVVPDVASNDENSLMACLHRIDLVQKNCGFGNLESTGNLELTSDTGRCWAEVCRELCHGRRSFAELRRAPWKDHLIGRIGYDFWQRVQAEAPTHLTLPSGNRVRVGYSTDRPPWIEARIQECFGWHETPRILGGKVMVQLHLLGPNRRPQQITDDLASFWKNTYGEIRKELRRRYPKHHWPEDPLHATATTNGLKPAKS